MKINLYEALIKANKQNFPEIMKEKKLTKTATSEEEFLNMMIEWGLDPEKEEDFEKIIQEKDNVFSYTISTPTIPELMIIKTVIKEKKQPKNIEDRILIDMFKSKLEKENYKEKFSTASKKVYENFFPESVSVFKNEEKLKAAFITAIEELHYEMG